MVISSLVAMVDSVDIFISSKIGMMYLLLVMGGCLGVRGVVMKHYDDCDVLCSNMSSRETVDVRTCIGMCDRMMDAHEHGIRRVVKQELLSGEIRVDNCGDRKDARLMGDVDLRTLEIDTRYIVDTLNSIEKTENKISKDNTTILVLEAVIIVIYILKPCLMYFIQARYKAEAPHDGCRGGAVDGGKSGDGKVLTSQDVIQAVDDIRDGFDGGGKTGSRKDVCIEFV